MSVFKFLDYKTFLRDHLENHTNRYGYKSKLAEAAGCQKSFLSLVMNAHAHLTLEHAAGLASFWRMDREEREYFIELVNYSRAGTPALKQYFRERLKEIKGRKENMEKRYQVQKIEVAEQSAIYYSSWHYGAIHMLISVPGFQTIPALAARLGLPDPVVAAALEILAQMGLARSNGARWESTQKSIHLPQGSYLYSLNHGHWRNRAVQESLNKDTHNIHYTAVFSMARADFEALRQLCFEYIDKTRQVIAPSPEEDIFCMNADLFRV